MRFRKLTIPPPTLDAQDWIALNQGMIPGYRRVWRDAQDITHLPVSEWSYLDQEAYANGWRPVLDLDGTFIP